MIAFIAVGGAVGSVIRWWLMTLFPVPVGEIPWITVAINVAGSFILGFLARIFMTHSQSPALVAALTVGFCGGFTTFSAFSADTLRLIQGGNWGRAALYVMVSVLLALGGIALGEWSAHAVRAG